MPNIEKYCKKCGYEIPDNGITMYYGKKVCECEGGKAHKQDEK